MIASRKQLRPAWMQRGMLALALACMCGLPVNAKAQAAAAGQEVTSQPGQNGGRAEVQPKQQPMTTGSPTGKMDAGESDPEMEGYRHSSTVQTLARVLHVPTERAADLFEDFNSGVLILVILYFLFKYLPAAFRTRRAKIEHDLVDARSATEIANQRLQAVEARLAMLDTEIEGIRQQAAHDSQGDQERIEASMEAERERIIRSAEQEIGAAQAAAQRELKRFTAELAIDRAMSRIELSADTDRELVSEFTESLSGVLHAGDFKKRGQN